MILAMWTQEEAVYEGAYYQVRGAINQPTLDPKTGSLAPNDPAFAKISPGAGPRHFAIAPSGKFVYLVNEMASTVTVLRFQREL